MILRRAAKKHQIEVRNCEKYIIVTISEIVIATPSIQTLLKDETNNGIITDNP